MAQYKSKTGFARTAVEVGFIVFLFYSNLLMGEYTKSSGHGKSVLVALEDIFTIPNFCIGVAAAIVAHFFFEHLRRAV